MPNRSTAEYIDARPRVVSYLKSDPLAAPSRASLPPLTCLAQSITEEARAVKVYIRQVGVDMEVKKKGTILDIYSADGNTRLGDLKITQTGLEWFNGKARSGPKAL